MHAYFTLTTEDLVSKLRRSVTIKYALDFDKGIYTFIPNEDDGLTTSQDCDSVRDKYEVQYDMGRDEF